MDIKQGIDQEIKTAELYQSQGLYEEARSAYDEALRKVLADPGIEQREELLARIAQKIDELEMTANKVEAAPATTEIAPQVQTLIKDLFCQSAENNPDLKALQGAVTLAKFGQIEQAVLELTDLLGRDLIRVPAAKNILRCCLLLERPEKAINTYQAWLSNEVFTSAELNRIRAFLEALLIRSGIHIPLPETAAAAGDRRLVMAAIEKQPVDLDFGSVVITFDKGPLKGKPIELDVKFQAGNLVSLIIESEEKALLDNLNVGFRLKNLQFHSSVAIYRGQGVISAKALIDSGPKEGNYHLDIKIEDA
jgi:tetratricopeptide (TPR) repeat protein